MTRDCPVLDNSSPHRNWCAADAQDRDALYISISDLRLMELADGMGESAWSALSTLTGH